MIRSDLRSRLRRGIGNPSTTDVPDATLNDHLDDALKYICENFRFRRTRKQCYFNTVAGTDRYALPSDCVAVYSVRDRTTPAKLRKRSLQWADAQNTKASGKPTDFVLYRDYIELWNNPDDVYEIQVTYRASADDFGGDSSEPDLPGGWHEGVWIYARFLYWDSVGDIPRTQYANSRWVQWVAEKPDEIGEEEFWDDTKGVDVGLSASRGLDFDHED